MIKINTVSVLRCENYEIQNIKKILLNSIDNIGGLEKYINKGEKVLLKINLVMPKKPDATATSQPEFVRALAEILIEYGAEVIVGDSPGGPFNEIALKAAYHVCGISKAIENCGARLNFNTAVSEYSNPNGVLLKRITVADFINDVDKIISVTRFKTHGMMKLTGVSKNMFGIVPGAMKAEYHLNRPNLDMFAEAMVDICCFKKPVLSFLDGIVAMEGKGPTNGTPRPLNFVMAGENPFAVDLASTAVISAKPDSVPIVKAAIKRGLCPNKIEDLNIVGDDLDSFKVTDFDVPNVVNINPLKSKLPHFAENFVNSNLQPKPVFKHDKCIGCGDCAKLCPPKAIEMVNNRPKVKLDNCIRCFCCQELCPKDAVEIERPLLYNIFSKI